VVHVASGSWVVTGEYSCLVLSRLRGAPTSVSIGVGALRKRDRLDV
jgi:hypothetical protein